MFEAIPPTWALLTFWPLAFVAGVVVGFNLSRYSERHKENMMDVAGSIRAWYDKWAPAFVIMVGVLAVIGIAIGAGATVTNGQQDRRADASTKAILKCFDEYTEASAATSKAVREASVKKDAASAIRDVMLGRALSGLVSGAPNLNDRVADLVGANAVLVDAQRALDEARAANPVPDPPSEFCAAIN